LSKHQVVGETNSGTVENVGVEPTILGCSMVLLFHPTACDEQTSVDASRKQEGELTVVWARMNNSISKKHMHQIAAELIMSLLYSLQLIDNRHFFNTSAGFSTSALTLKSDTKT